MPVKNKLDNYAAVIQARAEECMLRDKGQLYSSAVIEACEIWLRINPVPPFTFIEQSQPVER